MASDRAGLVQRLRSRDVHDLDQTDARQLAPELGVGRERHAVHELQRRGAQPALLPHEFAE